MKEVVFKGANNNVGYNLGGDVGGYTLIRTISATEFRGYGCGSIVQVASVFLLKISLQIDKKSLKFINALKYLI